MQVILLERVENLGQMGELVTVKPGYARNFLLPQRKALRATKANVAYFEQQKAQLEAANLEKRREAEAVAAKMANVSVTLIRQAAESGQLYGSVTARDIAQAVTEAGYSIDRTQVRLNQTIKTLGLVKAPIVLHPEVSIEATVNVARTEEEAARQLETGVAVTAQELEAEEIAAEEAAALAEAEALAAAALLDNPEDAPNSADEAEAADNDERA